MQWLDYLPIDFPGNNQMKCNKCSKVATMHITDILSKLDVQELHFCEDCAQKYLQNDINEKDSLDAKLEPVVSKVGTSQEEEEASVVCDFCAMKFSEFRNSGRLGCPHDYTVFHDDLMPYLENIHGETKHCGKSPSRFDANKNVQKEIDQLRKQLQLLIQKEKYEEAAALRDRIRFLENQ